MRHHTAAVVAWLQTVEPVSDSERRLMIFCSLVLLVYEQRDAAEYFEKILCLTSPEAAKVGIV